MMQRQLSMIDGYGEIKTQTFYSDPYSNTNQNPNPNHKPNPNEKFELLPYMAMSRDFT